MKSVNLIFPHQLFEQHQLLKNGHPIYLIEEWLFFSQYAFHKQKIALHRASMQYYKAYLERTGHNVNYISAIEESSDIRKLIPNLHEQGVRCIFYLDPADDWLEGRILKSAKQQKMEVKSQPTSLFLNSKEDLKDFFRPDKKSFFQTTFYKNQRKQRDILMDASGNPVGGKWTFDTDNRKKYPKTKNPPAIQYPESTSHYEEAIDYVNEHFPHNPGDLSNAPLYPHTHRQSRLWLDQFLEYRFAEFGPYEDAIVSEANILNHSVLSPMLNIGLLTPDLVLREALDFSMEHQIPINSTEGFVRQILGWREFIRGVYIVKGSYERTRNFWGFDRKIPKSFYDATTGIPPIDLTIKKVLKTGYCHHIERLMVLGNFMLLCEFVPDEVYRWFMELFIDAYDWVMVTNVYGMSQFADGGLMATKPYISGSNYLLKMSDFKRGPWQTVWDGLFWRFMHVNRDFFVKNPRLAMLIRSFDKMAPEKQQSHLESAQDFLNKLDQSL